MSANPAIYQSYSLATPWGPFVATLFPDDRLHALAFPRETAPLPSGPKALAQALHDYLALGAPLPDWPLDAWGTPFQERTWRTLCAVPFGQSVTYQELAARIGQPGAPRAVGRAMAQNPIPLFIPCHRVLAAGRKLGGYQPGADYKRRLLTLESIAFRD